MSDTDLYIALPFISIIILCFICICIKNALAVRSNLDIDSPPSITNEIELCKIEEGIVIIQPDNTLVVGFQSDTTEKF
tara:strand:- start:112 stop:345 length:234 start_codon:yes stop_codon:yes gene_type:complete